MGEKNKGNTLVILVLIASTVVQVITLMFLWNPDKFKETTDKLKSYFKKNEEKISD
jgi:hypothetical protein